MGRYGENTVQGAWQPPDPARHGESMAPAAQEQHSPDPWPDDRTTHAAMASAIARSRVQRLCQQSPPGSLPSSRACPHTAFVLTWFKIKERQASVSELLRILKLLCPKGF